MNNKRKPRPRVFSCPNCQATYHGKMIAIDRIAELCKRCHWKKPTHTYCYRGGHQYLGEKKKCVWKEYRKRGRKRYKNAKI